MSTPPKILTGSLSCAVALCTLLSTAGCSTTWEPDTALFQRAERYYTQGDYDRARDLYEQFLEEHPGSQLAEMARVRRRLLERELDAVMGRRGAPAPVRVAPTAPDPTETGPSRRFESPALPSLGDDR